MAAYAALISLDNTIHRILNHHLFPISLREEQQIIPLLHHVNLFQNSLEQFPDKLKKSLEKRVRELADEAEDILEYFMLEKVSLFYDARKSDGGIDLITREVDKTKVSCSSKDVQDPAFSSTSSWPKQFKLKIINTKFYLFCKNLRLHPTKWISPCVQGGVARSSSPSSRAPLVVNDATVGFEDYVLQVKERLCDKQSNLQVIPICGMGGIGKTTLAKQVYDDPLVVETFDIRVWVTISQDYNAQRILSSLLDSLKEFDTGRLGQTVEEKVHKILMCRRYLVVMDDVWSSEAWGIVRKVCPDDGNGSRVLLTTRLSDVASYPSSSSTLCEMHLMDAYQSWNLFKQKVLGDEDCPSELEDTGMEIARSCGGLPLAIVVIAGVVSTVGRDIASWQEISLNINSVDQNQIEEILSLSYFHLPQYLRPCFLYMGSFPEDEEIKVTKLIRLWVAEGFLKSPPNSDSFETVAEECLEELVKRNHVLVTKRKYDGRIKSYGLHDLMRDLCIRKAEESKFFLNLTNRPRLEKKIFIESVKNQRRVSINSSNLWQLSSSGTTIIRSIKCWMYFVVKLDFAGSVRLLSVLDAEPACVEYSKQLAEFFHLRYLAITYSHIFPSGGLSNLRNMQTLIIRQEEETKWDLWLEWCMPQLRHAHVDGIIFLKDPEGETCSLGSLQTVSHVSHGSCTERILKRIPNLKRLKVDCSGGEAACLNDLVHVHRLESLEVYAGCWVNSRPNKYNFTFPKMLKKLILRALVLPWNDIVVVGSLPNLKVLKLKQCICVGGTWETTEGEFPRLEFLLIEDCQFENWITESSHFWRLRHLLLHSCWCLNAIPNDIGEIPTLEVIEVKGKVKESLVKSVDEIQHEQEDYGNNTLQVICMAKSYDSDETSKNIVPINFRLNHNL